MSKNEQLKTNEEMLSWAKENIHPATEFRFEKPDEEGSFSCAFKIPMSERYLS